MNDGVPHPVEECRLFGESRFRPACPCAPLGKGVFAHAREWFVPQRGLSELMVVVEPRVRAHVHQVEYRRLTQRLSVSKL